MLTDSPGLPCGALYLALASSKLMDIQAEFARDKDGWIAHISGLPEARAYGSTRRQAAIGATIRAFHILADRVKSGELKVEEQLEAITLGGSAESFSELFLEPQAGPAPSAKPIAQSEEGETDNLKNFHSVEERAEVSSVAKPSDAFAAGPVAAPRTLADYYRLRDMLEELIAKVGADDSHPLAAFMDRVGTLVEQYENTHLSEIIESRHKR